MDMIQEIFNWCDRWCEKCNQTGLCPLYKHSVQVTSESPEEFLKTLSKIFETAKKMVKEIVERKDIDPETFQRSDFEDEYDWKRHLIRKDDGMVLAKKYRKQVMRWFNSLNDDYGMEVRMQDPILSDYLEVILWYQYLFEIKMARALISQKDAEEEQSEPSDSLGNAKLLLVSVERNIGAWGYVYQKFKEDEDEILDILISLQKIGKIVEQVFPEARAFIRPGLD